LFSSPSVNFFIATGCEPAGANVEASWNSVIVIRISDWYIKRDRVGTGKCGEGCGFI
jgi:hypothetical protein